MKNKTRVAAVIACAALGVVGPAAADTSDESLPGDDNSVPFWPHETGALMGTSETFVDMQPDGSYYDPGIGHRVFLVK